MDSERQPEIFVMEHVNIGDLPAPAISTEAVYKTANLFQEESSKAAEMLKNSSYVDDLIDSQSNKLEAMKLARDPENMLAKGAFTVKCWQFSGEDKTRSGEELQQTVTPKNKSSNLKRPLLKGTEANLRVLGLGWKPKEDVIVFEVTFNFSQKKRGVRTGPNLMMLNDLPEALPDILTKRIVLQQVMKIYDPLGFVSPFTLIGKIYLRETWSRNLDWDDQLPVNLRAKWVKFFISLFKLETLSLQLSSTTRCCRQPVVNHIQ